MSETWLQVWTHGAWTRLGVAAIAALLVAALLRRVAYGVLHRLARRHPHVATLMDRASAPMEWLLPLLMLVIALHVLPDADVIAPMLALRRLLVIALIGVTTWLAVRCVGALEEVAIHRYPVDVADNLQARRVVTQVRVFGRSADIVLILLGAGACLLAIPGVRELGASLLASAGVAGLALGVAAKPVLSNLIAGLQIALTQPIRLDDVVVIQGEWGRIEEITGSYVVVRVWDERRLIVPLNWFIENPFQNWTRSSARLVGSVFLWLDHRVPMAPLREELQRLCKAAPEWDGRVCVLQVTDASERAVQLRALVSSADSGLNWDLRCRVREGLIAFVQARFPEALPRWRGELDEPAEPRRPPRHIDMPPSPSAEDGGPRRET